MTEVRFLSHSPPSLFSNAAGGTKSSGDGAPELLIHSRNEQQQQPAPGHPQPPRCDPSPSAELQDWRNRSSEEAMKSPTQLMSHYSVKVEESFSPHMSQKFNVAAGGWAENRRQSCCWSKVAAFYPGDELFLSFPFSLKYQFACIKKPLLSSPEEKKKTQPP